MRILLPLLLIGLVACYAPRSVQAGPDGYTAGLQGAGSYPAPLQASLWIDPYTGFASFDVSREAHVALFAWIPGGYFDMLYPAIGYGTRQRFHGGRHHLRSLRTVAHGYSGRTRLPGHYASSGAMTGPTYFMLIASEEPLDIQPFYGRASWVSQASWSHNPYTATELLASQIVRRPATTDWTVAYQVVWFEDEWQSRDHYRWVQCPGGVTLMVPLDALYAGLVQCPTGDTAEVPPGDTAEAAAADRIARRVAERRAERMAMSAERASDAEVAAMIRRIHEARGRAAGAADAQPLPAWQRGERAAGPIVVRDRPDIRAERADQGEAAPATPAPAVRSGAIPPPRSEETRPRADPPPPQAEPRPQAERPRPQAERPRPQTERPRPQPQPQPERRPQPEPSRPAPERPQPEPSRPAPERPQPDAA